MDVTLGSVKGSSGMPLPITPAHLTPTAADNPEVTQPMSSVMRHEAGKDTEKKSVKTAQASDVSEEEWKRAVERALKLVQGPSTYLDFSVHKPTKEIVVRVMNKETGEVIREIPPEKHLDLVAELMKLSGIRVDTRV
ncbi:MAG: flagellar protein FlaG [Paenibacillus sp.]|jgi:flagellar protein FlaG|nr:flagellar protein FlaG [Paenibacillus sp.]